MNPAIHRLSAGTSSARQARGLARTCPILGAARINRNLAEHGPVSFRGTMKKPPAVAEPREDAEAGEAPRSALAPRKSRKSQGERRQKSMTLIMDTAEALFAEEGYNGVTLNEVAQAAGVDTSLMRYYFGDKQQLFRAVFRRRGPEINDLRLKAMAEYREAAGKNLQLEGVIDAFVRPVFLKMVEDDGWRNYMAIVAYVNSSRGILHTLMGETFHYVSREFIADLRRIYPKVAESELYWSYHFVTGSFTFSLGQTRRMDVLSEGLISSADCMAILERFPIALAGAIRAICERPQATRRPRPPRKRSPSLAKSSLN
jgi:AcrR family transcriptional regulator